MIADALILMFSIMGGLSLGYFFTDVIQPIHLMGAGFLFFLLFMFWILIRIKAGSNFGSRSSSSSITGQGRIKSPMEAIEVVNDRLKGYRTWEQVQVDTEYTKGTRKKIVNKKSGELETHWAILSEMKLSKLPVLIIYSEHEDTIVDYEPVPPALRRDELFKDFDPIKLERVMSRGYDKEEEEQEEKKEAQFDFNINDNRDEEESGGWFS